MFTSFILYKKFSKDNSAKKINIIRNYSIIFLFINLLSSIIFLDKAKTESNIKSSATITSINKIPTNYLEPKEELKDYIIDSGDDLLIKFNSEPRKISEFENLSKSKEDLSYLKQRTNLNKYILDSRDRIFIDFIWAPEYTGFYTIDKEGEISLPELGKVYVRGLILKELKNLLEKSYEEYLVNPELDITIASYKSIKSGVFPINLEGEIILPEIEETYVRGLTLSELEDLLERKYLQEFFIPLDISIRIAKFKRMRILISGEVRTPGIYEFPSYTTTNALMNFEKIENTNGLKNSGPTTQNSLFKDLTREINNTSRTNEFSKEINEIDNRTVDTENMISIKSPTNKFTTISNAIRRAGGITSKSDLSKIILVRDIPVSKGGGKKKSFIDLTDFLYESNPKNDLRLFDGDRIYISKSNQSNIKQIPQSVLTGLSPKFIKVNVFGRIETPGTVSMPLESTLSDLIDIYGPIKPLSGNLTILRYGRDGTLEKEKIRYSNNSRKGSQRNPYLQDGDFISINNSFFGKSTGVIREFTSPFLGIYATKELIEGFD